MIENAKPKSTAKTEKRNVQVRSMDTSTIMIAVLVQCVDVEQLCAHARCNEYVLNYGEEVPRFHRANEANPLDPTTIIGLDTRPDFTITDKDGAEAEAAMNVWDLVEASDDTDGGADNESDRVIAAADSSAQFRPDITAGPEQPDAKKQKQSDGKRLVDMSNREG